VYDMIIGNGFLAHNFSHYLNDRGVIFFVSGVSDSNEICESEFIREEQLLIESISKMNNELFVYFSSCYVTDKDMLNIQYYHHKENMETIIESSVLNYIIFRLPQVVGNGGNKNNLINFLFRHIKNGKKFVLFKKATRNLIDVSNVVNIVDFIISNGMYKNRIINIASNNNVSMMELVDIIESIVDKKALFSLENRGKNITIDVSEISEIIKKLKIEFDNGQVNYMLRRYHKRQG